MGKGRLEAFSDGVLAIIITIMVLEMKVPHDASAAALLMAAIAYYILQLRLIAANGPECALARALGSDWKGKLSPVLYITAIPLAFFSAWISCAVYLAVALIWLVPDRRIEQRLVER